MPADTPFAYIAIEGPIGVGKTTLAKKLAESCAGSTLLEAPEDNPFLPRFYRHPRAHALSTQLFFLMQRARQMQDLRQADMFSPVTVGDYIIEKDRLFAEINLDVEEFRLYQQIYEHVVASELRRPDLVVYLQAPVDVLRERIARRGVAYEAGMDPRYLQRLAAAYARFFYDYESTPLVIVNAAAIDIVHNRADYERLFEHLRTIRKGRHYLNPSPFEPELLDAAGPAG